MAQSIKITESKFTYESMDFFSAPKYPFTGSR